MTSAGVKTKQRLISFQTYYSTEIILYIPTQYAIMLLFPKAEIILKDNIHEANHKFCEYHDVPSLHTADSLYAL